MKVQMSQQTPFISRLVRSWRSLSDFLLPRLCCGCGQELALDEHLVCPACVAGLRRESLHDWNFNPGFARLDHHPLLQRVGAFAIYERDGIVASLVHRLKYDRLRRLGLWMGQWAARELQPTGLFDGVDALVPLPLTSRRLRWRGFNQAEAIAEGISRVLGIPVRTDLLCRTLDTESQTHFRTEQRCRNAVDAFSATQADCQGAHLMLIDDVMTTGTTLLGALHALQDKPDVRLSVFVFAWTPLS